MDFITNQLKKTDEKDKSGRSFIKRADDLELDIVFLKGEKEDSVRLDVLPHDLIERRSFGDYSYIGTYTSPEQFNIDEFREKNQSKEDWQKKRS